MKHALRCGSWAYSAGRAQAKVSGLGFVGLKGSGLVWKISRKGYSDSHLVAVATVL